MNRIGLITIHDTTNFGSQLQTFSLCKAVSSLGYDVKLIDYKCEAIEKRESTLPLSEVHTPKDIVKSVLLHGNLEKRKSGFREFLEENVEFTVPYTRSTIINANADFDTFLVGSDIVWGLSITGVDYSYMLDFADDEKKKIAFSSSVGTKWGTEDEVMMRKYLGRFDRITVRESEAAGWISELLGKQIEVTADPTMLWETSFWEELASDTKAISKDYVLVYMSDPENICVKKAIDYGRRHNMPVYYINYRAPVFGTKDIRPTQLREWISMFKNARVVFSASYHGLLFSLYFHKDVFFFNWTNKSRMNSLAQETGIEDREGTEENIRKSVPMDYARIDSVIQIKREESWEKLKEMLE